MPADAVTAARSLLRQGYDEIEARAALIDAGYSEEDAADAVRKAERDPGGPAGSRDAEPPRRPVKGSRSASRARRPAARTRAGRAVGGFESGFDRAAREAGRISLTPPRRVTARDGAGFLVGLLSYVLVLQYIRHGPDGVKGWVAAKFVNKPWEPPGKGGTGPASDNDGGLRSTRPKGPVAV